MYRVRGGLMLSWQMVLAWNFSKWTCSNWNPAYTSIPMATVVRYLSCASGNAIFMLNVGKGHRVSIIGSLRLRADCMYNSLTSNDNGSFHCPCCYKNEQPPIDLVQFLASASTLNRGRVAGRVRVWSCLYRIRTNFVCLRLHIRVLDRWETFVSLLEFQFWMTSFDLDDVFLSKLTILFSFFYCVMDGCCQAFDFLDIVCKIQWNLCDNRVFL